MPPGTAGRGAGDGTRYDLVRARPAGGGRARRRRRARQQALRDARRGRRRGSPSAGCRARRAAIELRLKLLADVGLVGLPNAGKSSLLARLTRAQPKVADYPFTTLEPVLGTLEADDRQLVIADIPGLIEGASDGAGLGHEFLAHVERTRLLVHVLDLAPLDGSDPAENHAVIERELAEHDARLAALPRILALSKADLVPPEDGRGGRARDWRGAAGRRGAGRRHLVARPAQGLDELARELLRRVPAPSRRPRTPARTTSAEYRVFRPAARPRASTSSAPASGAFRVSGDGVERLIARHDLENEEALALHRAAAARAWA